MFYTLTMIERCPFGYDYEINGDSMTADVYCGPHFLYTVNIR